MKKEIRFTLNWLLFAIIWICSSADVARCQQGGQDQVRDTLLSSLPLFLVLGLAAAAAAYAVRMIRRTP